MQHYQASGLKERRRLTVDFYMIKMELEEPPRKFLLCVDQMVKELERVDRPVDSKDIETGHPERTYAAVRRGSSHAKELIGLAHAGIDQTCCDKPIRAT